MAPRNILLHVGTTIQAHNIVVRRMLALNNLLLPVLVKLAEAALAPSPQASSATNHWPHAEACAHFLAPGFAAFKIGVVCHGELRRCCHLWLHLYHLHLHDWQLLLLHSHHFERVRINLVRHLLGVPLERILATIDILGIKRHLALENLTSGHTFIGDLLLNYSTTFTLLINQTY